MAEKCTYTDQIFSGTSVEDFAAKHLTLLELEREAEIEENKCLQETSSIKTLQKKGTCIPKMKLARTSTGLFGRSLLHFETFWGNSVIATHTISSGDIIGVGNSNSDGKLEIIASGVVTKVSDATITTAFEKNSSFTDVEYQTQYALIKLANDITYKRLKRSLKNLQIAWKDSHLVDVLFGNLKPSTLDEATFNDVTYFNKNLNKEQKEAVQFSLLQKEVSIIHGPPGTGKTTTVVECILQAVSQNQKILACAPSNVAVDNLAEKLSVHHIKMVRLGHPARFLAGIQHFSLDAIVSNYDGSNVVDELHKEIDKLREKINKTKGSAARKSLWMENKSLLKEVKEREKLIVKQILSKAEVVLCTLTSASNDGPMKYIEKGHFDLCFIDECSQAIEAACWVPLLQVRKCILAGDHNQLPPTIISEKAAKGGLEFTLMERLLKLHGDGIKRMLTTQYRMNQVIMKWPSDQLYEGKLVAHETVASHLLIGLPDVEQNDDTSIPLLMIDTLGCGLDELQVEEEESKGNEGEADLVSIHVKNLINSGMNPSDIAVITPYNLQVELIKARVSGKYPKLEIKSVDGFQGREKEAIVLSLVRSNDIGEVGFLSEDRRINVAITRAKRHLAVICNSKTVSCHPFLKSFVKYCEENGEVRSAFQYESEIGNYPSMNIKQSVQLKKEAKKSRGKDKTAENDVPASERIQRKAKVVKSEEEYRFTEENYTQIIQDFIKSGEVSYDFPSSTSAFQRRVIHEIAQKFDLIHISSGEGLERYIELKKKVCPQELALNSDQSSRNAEKPQIISQNKFSAITEDPTPKENSQSEPKSLTKIMPALKSEPLLSSVEPNITPQKQILDTRVVSKPPPKQLASATKSNPGASSVKPKQPQKPVLKVLNLKGSSDPEDDFDALIKQAVKADRTCRFGKCKKCVATLSQVCNFCKGRFCFEHFMPEIHSCGPAAKAHARSQIRKEHKLYAGSGKPQKKVDPIAHNYLQNKLQKKITELNSQRKPKPKS